MKPTRIVLTETIKTRVEQKVEECLKLAREKYPKHTFETPEIRFDLKNSFGGLAYTKAWMIRLNLIMCYENEDHFVDTTVPHEVAHLVQYRVHGNFLMNADGTPVRDPKTNKLKRVRAHGLEWAEVMKLFGLPAERCHSYSMQSIQRFKRKKRGSKLGLNEIGDMMKRLEGGIKRLPFEAKLSLRDWLNDNIMEDNDE